MVWPCTVATYCINAIICLDISIIREHGKPRKIWLECISDLTACSIIDTKLLGQTAWSAGVRYCLVLPTLETWTLSTP